MKFDRTLLCLLVLGILSLSFRELRAEEDEQVERGEILVVYPEEAVKRSRPDNLSAIAQILFSMSYHVDWAEAEYAADEIKFYDKVIWCATAESDRLDPLILDGFEGLLLVLGQPGGLEHFGIKPVSGLEGKLIGTCDYMFEDNYQTRNSVEVLNVGSYDGPAYINGTLNVLGADLPLVSGSGNVHYIPLIDYTTEFAKALLMQEIGQWLWVWDSHMHMYSQHIVLDEIYPFTDPYRLQQIVSHMVELKMNFVISVMPIYDHADYPAMQRFCEVLRYAQANGGAVILHAPLIQTEFDFDSLAAHVTTAMRNYFDNGVWLLGMEVPSEWIFHEETLGILRRSRTLFFSDADAFDSRFVNEYDIHEYLKLGNQQVVPAYKLNETGASHTARCSTAVYVNVDMTTDDVIYAAIDAVKDAPIPMQSLWSMEQGLYADDFRYLTWDRNTLIVNGVQRFNNYEPAEIENKFDYKRNVYYRFVTNLANQNQFLIWLSGVVLVLFIFLVFQSRQQMHKRYLKKSLKTTDGEGS